MKIEIEEDHTVVLKEVYNSIVLETNEKERFVICMRDSGFEFKYNGIWYEAKDGKLSEVKNILIVDNEDGVYHTSGILNSFKAGVEAAKGGFTHIDNSYPFNHEEWKKGYRTIKPL